MNKAWRKLIGVCGVMGLLSIPIVAKPVVEKVQVWWDETITYTLEGEDILEDVETLTYKDKYYVEVSELGEALGFDVTIDADEVAISKKEASVDYKTIDRAVIKAIDLEAGIITILPEGLSDKTANDILLHVADDTTLVRHEKNRMAYRLESLTEGTYVEVRHAVFMTASLPPQTSAYEIVILGEQEQDDADSSVAWDNARITAINYADNTMTFENTSTGEQVTAYYRALAADYNERVEPAWQGHPNGQAMSQYARGDNRSPQEGFHQGKPVGDRPQEQYPHHMGPDCNRPDDTRPQETKPQEARFDINDRVDVVIEEGRVVSIKCAD